MKVECTRIINGITQEEYQGNQNGYLEKGKTYIVLEVYSDAVGWGISYRIVCDDGRPVILSADQFIVIDGTIPPNWQLFYEENNTMILRPKSWNELRFWDEYFDGESTAEDLFEKEHSVILSNS